MKKIIAYLHDKDINKLLKKSFLNALGNQEWELKIIRQKEKPFKVRCEFNEALYNHFELLNK